MQSSHPTFRQRIEFAVVWLLVRGLGILPRTLARAAGAFVGRVAYRLLGRLRRTGMRNLEIAYPEKSEVERTAILHAVYRNLGWQLAEFCLMGRYSRRGAEDVVFRYEGLQNFEQAQQRGKGTLVLTGHLGAWELSSFLHSLCGSPMGMVIRRLDNPLVDRFVNRIRCLHGNRVLHKDDFARGLLRAMAANETVGILMDTNMTPPQGVFVPYFGVEACTASGLARVARATGAAVIPGFLLWSADEKKYVLHFGRALDVQRTEDAEADAVANTALFTRTIENYVRSAPEQWLWLHRRWKTRPAGDAGIY
ncbi:MAG: lysophospholipid acyltransferase family protein [Acidobacteria bacterium]|nr:lysophospholipid acyltransferase family protein [Acidobacteriota bacterium]